MTDEQKEQEFQSALGRRHHARAAALAEGLGLDQAKIRELREKALWQMAAVNRNMQGTRLLAEQYGLSKKDLEETARRLAQSRDRKDKALEPCYDHGTGRYLPFEEWIEVLMKNWDKLS